MGLSEMQSSVLNCRKVLGLAMDHGEEDDFAPPSRRTRRPHANEFHDSGLMSDKSSFRGASTAASHPEMSSGLNLSFGFTPMQFEKLDLRGNHKPGPGREGMGLSEHAIESLVLSGTFISGK
eukprot:s913_g5.t1